VADLFAIPASVAHARATLGTSSVAPYLDDDAGRLLRGLSATKSMGVSLVSGAAACDLAAWIIDGMDMSCRLVVHHEAEADGDVIKAAFNNDLRVTTHEQPFVQFLDDVSSHRFVIVVMTPPVLDVATLDRAVAAINDGGILCLLNPDDTVLHALELLSDFCLLQQQKNYVALVKRPESNRPRRRGGRKRDRDA